MRHTLDESPNTGDLELIGMLPAHLRKLVIAWRELEARFIPGRSGEMGTRHGGSSDPVLGEVIDSRREALSRFRNARRMEIIRMAELIDKRTREVKFCKTCRAENSWDDPHCEVCGAQFTVCTKPADA